MDCVALPMSAAYHVRETTKNNDMMLHVDTKGTKENMNFDEPADVELDQQRQSCYKQRWRLIEVV